MLDLDRVRRDDQLLRAVTGLNSRAFADLKPAFTQALAAAPVPRRSDQPRERQVGGGRKPRLASIENKLIYILFYCQCHPTFSLAGQLFGLNRSQANRWMHRLQPVLEAALGQRLAPPERKLRTVAEFIEAFPEVEQAITDATECPAQRA